VHEENLQQNEYYFNKLNPIKLYRKRKHMQMKRQLARQLEAELQLSGKRMSESEVKKLLKDREEEMLNS
jgi:hypothetical protein